LRIVTILTEGWLWRGWRHFRTIAQALAEHQMSHIKPTKRRIAAARDQKKKIQARATATAAREGEDAAFANWEWRDPTECFTWRSLGEEVSSQLEEANAKRLPHASLRVHMGFGGDGPRKEAAEQCTFFFKAKRVTNIDRQMNYKLRRRPKPHQPAG